jgi:hypothetical protein
VAGTKAGTQDTNHGGFLLPGSAQTWRIIANRYQCFVFIPGIVEVMDTTEILSLLIDERDKLSKAIEALQGIGSKGIDNDPPSWVTSSTPLKTTPAAPASKKRTMSAAARKRISDATKARWARVRAIAATEAPAKKAAEKASAIKRKAAKGGK